VSVAHLTDVGSDDSGDAELAVDDIAGEVPLEHPPENLGEGGDAPESEE
jgi:hypothetical protein